MGFLQDLIGKTAATASRGAARDTYDKQRGAIDRLLGYGDEYATGMGGLSRNYFPYTEVGQRYQAQGDQIASRGDSLANPAASGILQLLQNPESVRSLPGYQFDQQQGIQALDRSAAASGRLNSGRQAKDLMRFGTGLADKTYGDQLARLMGVFGAGNQASLAGNQFGLDSGRFGLGATGAMTDTAARGLTGQLGARTTAYGGDMTSAGTIGQGDIAAANAKAAGSQNLLNTGLKIGGMALGAMTGNPMMMMGSMGGGGMFGGGNPSSAAYGSNPFTPYGTTNPAYG